MTDTPRPTATEACRDWDEVGAALVETIRTHYAHFRDDVEQMRSLVEDAIGKLISAYHILQAQAKIGYEVMRAELEEGEAVEVEGAGVGHAGTSAALTALQFEDVLTQLLRRLGKRCDRFRPLPTTLVEGVLKTVGTQPDDPRRQDAFEQVRLELCRVRAEADDDGEREIKQRSMDPGSVELF